MDKNDGFVTNYVVRKISNPQKKMDCVVLEFDDPIARAGIFAWAEAMNENGYHKAAAQIFAKLCEAEDIPVV